MSAGSSQPDFATLQQAAKWFAELESGPDDGQRQARWQAWLDASEQHRLAWRRVLAVQQGFAAINTSAPQARASRLALDAAARGRSRRGSLRTLGVLGVSALAAWAGLREAFWRADLQTATGETRDFTLPDGGRIWLSPDSAVRLAYGPQQRELVLQQGEVLIETAHDSALPARPFVVCSLHGRMRALGTRFSVRQVADDSTTLAVFEGAVEARAASGPPHVVPAGRQIGLGAEGLGPENAASPAREAWRGGLLLADDMPLPDFLAELGRWRRGHLGSDPALAGWKITGAFPLQDSDRALAMLAQALPLRIETITPWWVTVLPR
ncbi:DUF4880 domain-containing protein [Xylophilus rhododendri]|uniref:DUF4880 domain-containing protein n=1 Tax=Xylophilus rhododendri TaxID=2697032 RepID=A0A857JB14_9BURK|nr:FecR domain-containing protein [Xylophilus rhododendri]QHJ00342.1 DUF4880 domain-containing protein [Xylophilus rhododendri]